MSRGRRSRTDRGSDDATFYGARPPAPGDTFASYELVEAIGAGGMGEVWRARHVDMDRMVAVKLLPPELASDKAAAKRLLKEAGKLYDLKHPSIASVMHCGIEADTAFGPAAFLAMELLEGPSLADHLADSGPLPLEQVLEILTPIAEALDHAHGQGFVHRDVKPSNILFTAEVDEGGVPKLIDFGIAAKVQETLERTGLTKSSDDDTAIAGTLSYMSPEQFSARVPKGPSDVWALAVVLYELLTDRLPFAGPPSERRRLIREEDPEPVDPEGLSAEVAARLHAALMRGLEKAPEDRPATASEFLAGVRAAASGQVVAGPVTQDVGEVASTGVEGDGAAKLRDAATVRLEGEGAEDETRDDSTPPPGGEVTPAPSGWGRMLALGALAVATLGWVHGAGGYLPGLHSGGYRVEGGLPRALYPVSVRLDLVDPGPAPTLRQRVQVRVDGVELTSWGEEGDPVQASDIAWMPAGSHHVQVMDAAGVEVVSRRVLVHSGLMTGSTQVVTLVGELASAAPPVASRPPTPTPSPSPTLRPLGDLLGDKVIGKAGEITPEPMGRIRLRVLDHAGQLLDPKVFWADGDRRGTRVALDDRNGFEAPVGASSFSVVHPGFEKGRAEVVVPRAGATVSHDLVMKPTRVTVTLTVWPEVAGRISAVSWRTSDSGKDQVGIMRVRSTARVLPGTHRFLVQAPGWESQEVTVQVRPGEPVAETVTMRRKASTRPTGYGPYVWARESAGAGRPVSVLALAPDGAFVGLAYQDRGVEIVSGASGKVVHSFARRLPQEPRIMVVKGQSDWDMAGVILADGSGWGARNRRRGIEFEVEPTPIGPVRLLAVSDQQERGVGVLEDGTAKAIDGSDLTTLKGRFSDAIAAAAAGTGVAVLTPDRAQLFAHETGEQMGEIVKGYGKLTCLALDGYRKWFVAGSSQGEVQGYRATSKGSSAVQLASAKSSFDGLTALAFVRDHRHPEATKGGTEYPRNLLVLGYRSGRVAVHDPLEDKHLGDLDPMLEGIQRLEVTVEEDRLLVLGEKGALRMYEVPAGAPPTQATPTPPAGKPFEGWTIVPR